MGLARGEGLHMLHLIQLHTLTTHSTTVRERLRARWALNLLDSEFDVNWQPEQATSPAPAAASSSAAAASAASSKAAFKVAATSALGIFDRPMEPTEAAAAQAATPTAPEKTDLEKYLLLKQEPMDTNVLACGGSMVEAARPQQARRSVDRPPGGSASPRSHGAPVAGLPGLARPHRPVSSASSLRRAECTTTLRVRWRTAHLSIPSLPMPTQSEAG